MKVVIQLDSELDAQGIEVTQDTMWKVKEQVESVLISYLGDYLKEIVGQSGAVFTIEGESY